MPSVSLSLPTALAGPARTWVCLSCMFWPEELEALHSHTFRVKTFKKAKHCSVCKQTIVQDGFICRVCRIACHKKCEVKNLFMLDELLCLGDRPRVLKIKDLLVEPELD
ncbi:Ras-like protein [Sarotherodon galilaeus]